jgi:hypothetical protein
VRTIGGVGYLRPEVALPFKANHDWPKDRSDLLAARLDPAGRDWLADTLDLLGHDERLGSPGSASSPGRRILTLAQ